MKILKKLIFLFISLLFCQISLVASTNHHLVPIDTIPAATQKYKGNRIEVKSIKVTKKRGKTVKIEYNLSNSGKNKIKLGKGKNIPEDLIVVFDKSLEENGLTASKASLIENLKKQSISIRPGQLIMKNKLKFDYLEIPPTDRIAETEIKNENIELVENTNLDSVLVDSFDIAAEPMPRKRKSQPIPEFVFPELEAPALGETILTKPEEENTEEKTTTLPSIKSEEEKTPKKELETKVVREQISVPQPLPKIVVQLPITLSKLNFQFLSPEELEAILSAAEIEEEETKEIIVEEINIQNENTSTDSIGILTLDTTSTSTERRCADLIIEKVEIVKKSKRNVTVRYTLKNIGNAPISLVGKTKKDDNLAITAHFTRSEKLTRGSIPVKLFYLKKGLKSINGILEPNQTFTQKLKIETFKMSKFTPVLALSIDPLQISQECTKINNVSFINITENAAPSPLEQLPMQPTLKQPTEEIIGANGAKE